MKLDNLLSKLSAKQNVIIKNSQLANVLADIIIYYIEEEPNSEFAIKYKSEIGKDFDYKIALPLYLKYVKGMDCDITFDRFYTKISPK